MKKVDLNTIGADRKNLVSVIAEALDTKAIYQKVPTCAYKIGGLTITKESALTWDFTEDTIAQVALKTAEDAGFIYDEQAVQDIQEESPRQFGETESIGGDSYHPALYAEYRKPDPDIGSESCFDKESAWY